MAVAFHRIDMEKADAIEHNLLCVCHGCRFDFRNAATGIPFSYDKQATELLHELNSSLLRPWQVGDAWNLEQFEIMRHLCGLMTSRYKHVHLREFLSAYLGVPDISIPAERIFFEIRPIQERHHLLQLTAWLMVDLKSRLTLTWRAGAIRYNTLLKDVAHVPRFYHDLVDQFANWRDRLK